MLIIIPGKHDEQRKNLRSQPKECATEGSLSRSSSVSKRNTASFQVDFTSDVIAKLERDREMLLNRLVKPKKKESTPRKPLHALARRSSTSRIEQIFSVYQGSTKPLPSYQEFESATTKIRHQLGIISPVKTSLPSLTLSPMEDLKLCSGKLTWSQRSLLKSELRKIGKYIFAPTHKDVLEHRIRRLQECRNLDLGGNYKGKLFLSLVGNVRKANSLSSLLLVSLFDDDDGYRNLTNLLPVFNQLKFNTLIGHDVVWYVTGDLKFIGALYGHLGSASVYPCIFAKLPKISSKKVSIIQAVVSFQFDAIHTYNFLIRDRPKLSAPEKVQIHLESKSIARVPLVRIPISNIIPPSLHIVQGLAQNIISWIEKANPNQISALEDVYKRLGAQNRPGSNLLLAIMCADYLPEMDPKRSLI
uniref:Uncharacterized protein n=1 Tax=Ditylenchus dipsaci TaxID=166011 RepID=A0A915EQF4_9BILA